MTMHQVQRAYRPADLMLDLVAALSKAEGEEEHTFEVNVLRHGMDNWSVDAIVTVFHPSGTRKKLKLEVHEIG